MKRRRFIALSALGTATLTVPFLNCTDRDPELDEILSIPDMMSHLTDSKTITEIGKAYGTKMQNEYTIKKIEGLLVSNVEGRTVSVKTSPANIHSFIAKKIHEDFESGKIIILNGWVLSVTEARQSALFSLIHL